jgi:hypothetical protein
LLLRGLLFSSNEASSNSNMADHLSISISNISSSKSPVMAGPASGEDIDATTWLFRLVTSEAIDAGGVGVGDEPRFALDIGIEGRLPAS